MRPPLINLNHINGKFLIKLSYKNGRLNMLIYKKIWQNILKTVICQYNLKKNNII